MTANKLRLTFPVCRFTPMGKVLVPVDARGRALDWLAPNAPNLPLAVGPFGPYHFHVGCYADNVGLDFVPLPDGTVALHADGLGPHAFYAVRPRDQTARAAWRLTERVIAALDDRGVRHDRDGFACDNWYWFRATASFCAVKPYAGMEDFQLRWDDTLREALSESKNQFV